MTLLLQLLFSQLLIDFGTQYIKTTTIKNRKPDIVLDHQSKRKILNCVGYTTNLWLGNDCSSYLTRRPQSIAMSTKLLLPLLIGDVSPIKFYQSLFPVPVANNMIKLDEDYTILDIFAIIINQIQEYHDLEVKAKDIYLILPYYYSYELKSKIQQLSAILDCTVTLLVENTMAMVQYAQSNQLPQYFENNKQESHYYMVFDMGHMTTMSLYKVKYFASSVVTSINTMGLEIECLQQHHAASIGGYVIDLALRDFLASEFNKKYPKLDITTNPRAMMQLLLQSQKIKERLSANNELAFTMEQIHEEKDFKYKINRAEFEKLITFDVQPFILELLQKAQLEMEQIQSVIVIGGTIRIPKVQEQLSQIFTNKLSFQVDGDEGNAMGAAYYYTTQSPRFIMKPYNISDIIEYEVSSNNTVLIPKHSRVGLKKYLSFKTIEDFSFNLVIDGIDAYTVHISNLKWATNKVDTPIKEKIRILIEINKSGLISVGEATYDAILPPKVEAIEEEPVKESTDTENTDTDTADTDDKQDTDNTDDKKDKPKVEAKPIKMSFPLKVQVDYLLPYLTKEDITASKQR